MSRHRIANRAKVTRARAVSRRRRASLRESMIAGWLGVGALTLGLGAAALGGAGVACADTSSDTAATSAAGGGGDSGAPRSKPSGRGAAAGPTVRRASSSATRSVKHVPAFAGEVRSAATASTSRHVVVPTAGAEPVAPAAAVTVVRPSPDRAAVAAARRAATVHSAAPPTVKSVAAAAPVRQAPIQALVARVVNSLVALGGMDPVAPEPAVGNAWQQGLYSVARRLADAANPDGIPKVVTTSIGTPDPETGVVVGRALFHTASGAPLTYRVSTDPTEGTATINPDGSYSYVPLQSTWLSGATVKMVVTAYNGVQKSSQVYKIPFPKTGNLFTFNIQVGGTPAGLALTPAGNRLVVANPGSNTISVFDTVTNTKASPDIAGKSPFLAAAAPDGSAVYVENLGTAPGSNDSGVSRVSMLNNTVVTIPVNDNRLDFLAIGQANTPAANRLYLSTSSGIAVIDTTTNTILPGTISVGQDPFGLALSPNGQRLYVANSGDNTVSVIDTATNTATATVPIPIADPSSLRIYTVVATPDGQHVYVVGSGVFTANQGPANGVWVIDSATNTVSAPISVGSGAFFATVSPDGSVVYVANYLDNTVSAINTATNTVFRTINVGNGPFGVAVSSNRLYVANSGDGTVKVMPVGAL